jgi:DNA-binding LacI/PurR family transcriptional regulator
MSEIISGIQEALATHNLHFVIYLTDNDPQKESLYLKIPKTIPRHSPFPC